MVHTVGLLGPNGRIGALTLPLLVKAHQEGKTKLVVLTRPGSEVKGLTKDSGITIREINLEGGAEHLDEAVKGINVLLTAIAAWSTPLLNNIVDALKRSPEAITIIPSRYGSRFSPDDYSQITGLEMMGTIMDGTEKHAKEVGFPITVVLASSFHDYFFHYNFARETSSCDSLANVDIKANKIEANAKQLENPFPITNTEDLAAGLADIVTRDPESIKNQTFSVISHWVTGNEMVETFTKINGAKPEVRDYDEEAKKALNAEQPFGPVAAAYKLHWEKGPDSFGYENQQKVSGRSFEQTARDSLREIQAAPAQTQ